MPKSKVITHKKWTAYHGDLRLSLRKIGNSMPSISVEVDEGDGINFFIHNGNFSDKCRDEWIGQLEIIIEKLKGLKND